MIPLLIIGFAIIIFCTILIWVWGTKNNLGLRFPNDKIAFIVLMMAFAIVAFIVATRKSYYNSEYYRIEVVIKSKTVDEITKTDTLMRFIEKD